MAISTLMPCMNFSEERESGERTTFSLTKWMSIVEFVEGHVVLEVAVESVRLLDQERAAAMLGTQFASDLKNSIISLKPCTPRSLRGLDVDELLDDREAFALGVFVQGLLSAPGSSSLPLSCSSEETRA